MSDELDIQRDPDSGLPFFYLEDGQKVVLACLKPERLMSSGLPAWGDHFKALPRDMWYDYDLSWVKARDLNQNPYNACVGHGAVSAFETAWLLAGNAPQDFSAFFTYGLINGGRDNGANVLAAMEAMLTKGVSLEKYVPPGMWQASRFPREAYTVAERFKLAKAYRIDSFDEGISAIYRNHIWVFGIDIGSVFRPDRATGIVPPRRGGGGGHCMMADGVKRIDGRWYINDKNSWARSWGVNGRCWLDESYFQGEWGHFAIVCAKEDPQDPNPTPAMK